MRHAMNKLKYSHDEPTKQVRLISFKDFDAIFYKHFGNRYSEYRKKWYAAQDRKYVPPFPLSLDFETNNYCNLRCRMCLFSTNLHPDYKQKKGLLGLRLFKKTIDEGREYGLPALTFGFESEPLLNKNIVEMIYYARKHDVMDIRVGTNGILLNGDTSEKLIDSGLTRLEVSVDALTKETYDKIRHGGNYYRLLKNIFQFLELRHKRGSDFPLLRVSFLKMDINKDELVNFINFWKGTADYFSIQNLFDYEILEEHHKIRQLKKPVPHEGYYCAKIAQRMYVRYNGIALPCGYVFGWEKMRMGDLNKISVAEAWNSNKFKRLRRIHRESSYWKNAICHRCVAHTTTGDLDVERQMVG